MQGFLHLNYVWESYIDLYISITFSFRNFICEVSYQYLCHETHTKNRK